jgi:hypothetical protein
MNNNCPIHNVAWKEFTKDGKSWRSHSNGDKWCNEKSPEVQKAYETGVVRETVKEDKPDWDAIALGKVRHGVAIAFIEAGIKLSDELKEEMNQWVKWIMNS